jgi:UrcA family protein
MRFAACILALATAGATLSAATVPALAQDIQTVVVDYDDLNLNAPSGRATLDARIKSAARRICGPAAGPSPFQKLQLENCLVEVTERANSQVFAALGSASRTRTAR